MKSVTTYLHFDGNCRQAMLFYQQCLRAQLQLNAYPDADGQPSLDPGARIMHSQLSQGGAPVLMASDGAPGGAHRPGNNFSVTIDCGSPEEAQSLFTALSTDGNVTLPLGKMPWGASLGMLSDRFGIQWMISCD